MMEYCFRKELDMNDTGGDDTIPNHEMAPRIIQDLSELFTIVCTTIIKDFEPYCLL